MRTFCLGVSALGADSFLTLAAFSTEDIWTVASIRLCTPSANIMRTA